MPKPKPKDVPRLAFEVFAPGSDSPGPGHYDHSKTESKRRERTRAHKLGERYSKPLSDAEITPGPGNYSAESVPRGHHTRSPGFSLRMRPATGNPVAHAAPEHTAVPGPGHYHTSSPVTPRSARGTLNKTSSTTSLGSTGSLSKSKPSSSFGTSPRFKSTSPHEVGPGSYNVARATPMSKKGVKIGTKLQQRPREVFDLLYTPGLDSNGNHTKLGHSGRQ